MQEVTIYTDGSCLGNPGPGGWGAILIAATGAIKKINGHAPDTTNNRMELSAAIEALKILKQKSSVTLYTDSSYVKDGIEKWIKKWQISGWRTSSKQPVKNCDLWKELLQQTERHEINWQWVRSHNGNQYNEEADRLAKTGSRNSIE